MFLIQKGEGGRKRKRGGEREEQRESGKEGERKREHYPPTCHWYFYEESQLIETKVTLRINTFEYLVLTMA